MLFIKTTKWMGLKYIFISGGINKWWSTQIMEYYSAINRKEVLFT